MIGEHTQPPPSGDDRPEQVRVGDVVDGVSPVLLAVLESAAVLQGRVPDAVLVGGSAAALYARHRDSFDHDHVLADLRDRFDLVLEALEREPDWVLNRAVPRKILLGQLGDIEAGVRQLRRTVPLEVVEVALPSGRTVRAPTADETLRIKGFLITTRNQTRDHLDVAGLAERYGTSHAAHVLSEIDRYYTDPAHTGTPVADQVLRQLAAPAPKDSRTTTRLAGYKRLTPRLQSWDHVVAVLADVAEAMRTEGGGR
ncbi:hypothetical protein [Litorihabitans aurantiacus]|uniref:Nucleotidyl transferase AbiEii/AbiGii toxin family protein n=1 Tax=Litorihabitans aurantiacus TaxID=1930061 RepID=A0AA37UUC3_9MICO|nr:hypothetical protein [Litorihabitans aurantiacus]GMA30411.1 hypothetical protein GCM10025875_04030 [Litorihabitans aurantiacus]